MFIYYSFRTRESIRMIGMVTSVPRTLGHSVTLEYVFSLDKPDCDLTGTLTPLNIRMIRCIWSDKVNT